MNKNREFPGWWALLPTLGAYCILSAGPHAWFNRKVLASRVFVGVGLISYPLYLWHWPLLVFARILNGDVLSIRMRYGIFLISLLLSWLTYQLIEKPIRSGKYSVQKVALLCVLMLFVGVAGLYTYERDGFDFRYPEKIRELTRTNDSYSNDWREKKCFLNPEDGLGPFSDECTSNKRPLVFLWGDSHAAALYPGLKDIQTRYAIGVAQYTSSACPPLMHFVTRLRPNCRTINDFILEQIRKTKPDIVLLHADWTADYDLSKLDDTIAELKKIGVARIVLLGPVPQWKDTLAHDILAYWRNTHADPPLRMNFRLMANVPSNDQKMSEASKRLGIEYISAYQAMCNQDGCLTRVAKDSADITSFDCAHLTPKGADLLVNSIIRRVMGTR
jgi:hypothetical protein